MGYTKHQLNSTDLLLHIAFENNIALIITVTALVKCFKEMLNKFDKCSAILHNTAGVT